MNKYKGWGPWKNVWLSGCSRHQKPTEKCHLCKRGEWTNVWWMTLNQWAFALSPSLWQRWANRNRRRKAGQHHVK